MSEEVLNQFFTEKECLSCGKLKPPNDFYTKGHRLDSSCKECVLERKTKRYKARMAIQKRLESLGKKEITFVSSIEYLKFY